MIADEFLAAVRDIRHKAPGDVIRCLARPPGTQPSPDLSRCPDWYNTLNDEHKALVRCVAASGCDHGLTRVMTLVDGTGSMAVGGEAVVVEIYLIRGGRKVFLNPPDGEPPNDRVDWSS